MPKQEFYVGGGMSVVGGTCRQMGRRGEGEMAGERRVRVGNGSKPPVQHSCGKLCPM